MQMATRPKSSISLCTGKLWSQNHVLYDIKHKRCSRMWDMFICKHMASVRADFDLPYSLPILCQIGPELCELGINLNPCPCATNVCLQIVNNHSLFRDIAPLVTTIK